MSWILKQAEDMLNRVDQQANAAVHQHSVKSTSKQSKDESMTDSSSLNSSNTSTLNSTNRSTIDNRRNKKNDDVDLINYLNSSTPTNNKPNRTVPSNNLLSETSRTASSPNMLADDALEASEQSLSKSATDTPRSITPAVQTHDEDEGLIFNIPSTKEYSINENNNSEIDFNQSSNLKDEIITSLQTEIQTLMRDKRQYENDLQTYKRQQIQHQHQIAESDALLRDLRSRETDSTEALSAKDSQIALLRVRLGESDGLAKTKTSQCEQLQSQCARILQDHTDSSGIQSQAFDSLQFRITQLEQELQHRSIEKDRLIEEKHLFEKRSNDERQQLLEQLKLAEKRSNNERIQAHDHQQQTKHAKNLIHQLEQDMNDYKAKAQRILQTKDKLIVKLKEIVQHRNNLSTGGDQNDIDSFNTTDDPTLMNVNLVGSSSSSSSPSHWANVQYEEIKAENELFKQELQARELTIHTLRSELQETELLVQHADEQLHEQTNQLNEQLKEEHARLLLAEQDYRKLKQELTYTHDEFHKQKQTHLTQLNERERELERLRSQLTAKTINHVNDDELEKRLQTLTESLIHKQTIIESLQTDKSSLTMQLERLEKRLDDYEKISSTTAATTNNSLQQSSKRLPTSSSSIAIDMDNNTMYDNDHDESLRYRIPLLRETPYDPDITKKVKRAANELDKLGIRLGIFLKRYPAVRLGVIFYTILLHLWTLIVLFTYTPEVHGNINSLDMSHKS